MMDKYTNMTVSSFSQILKLQSGQEFLCRHRGDPSQKMGGVGGGERT